MLPNKCTEFSSFTTKHYPEESYMARSVHPILKSLKKIAEFPAASNAINMLLLHILCIRKQIVQFLDNLSTLRWDNFSSLRFCGTSFIGRCREEGK